MSGVQAVTNAGIKAGDFVVVSGAGGGLGHLAVQVRLLHPSPSYLYTSHLFLHSNKLFPPSVRSHLRRNRPRHRLRRQRILRPLHRRHALPRLPLPLPRRPNRHRAPPDQQPRRARRHRHSSASGRLLPSSRDVEDWRHVVSERDSARRSVSQDAGGDDCDQEFEGCGEFDGEFGGVYGSG